MAKVPYITALKKGYAIMGDNQRQREHIPLEAVVENIKYATDGNITYSCRATDIYSRIFNARGRAIDRYTHDE
jgi:hypothetical protein